MHIQSCISMEIKNISIAYKSKREDELESSELTLVQKAKDAALKAYAPYSFFQVGAAVLLSDGTYCTGNNQENAAYPSGLCAERVALFYASANYPDLAVKAIAICAYKNNEYSPLPISPCGSCRQVINETGEKQKKTFKLILYGTRESYVFDDANALLPLSFDHTQL